MYKLFYILILVSSFRCGLDCIDKKTGLHKSSQTLQETFDKNVFQYEMLASNNTFQLDSGKNFKINSAWIENSWKYECVDNSAVIKKDSTFQLVIDGDFTVDIMPAGLPTF